MSELNFNKMVLKLVPFMFLLFSASLSLPLPKTKYDQRQEGEMNVRADLDNILVLFVHSGGIRLVDDQQIGSILQIFGNSRKNPPVSDGSNKESPYKVEIQQSAIEKLQSDVDSLNTILPISKNYNNIEKKESIDSEQQTITKTEDNKSQETTTSGLPSSISDASTTTMPTKVTPEITTSETTIASVPIQKTSEKMSTEKEKTSQTLPQPATSVTVISPKPSPSDDAASIASKIHQKIIQTSTSKNHQTKSSSASQIQPARSSSATVSSKTSKFLNIEEQKREEQLKSLRSGLVHCLPGQRLTEDGDCVEIEPTRESRQEKMERLLSLLRFGVQPANNNH